MGKNVYIDTGNKTLSQNRLSKFRAGACLAVIKTVGTNPDFINATTQAIKTLSNPHITRASVCQLSKNNESNIQTRNV